MKLIKRISIMAIAILSVQFAFAQTENVQTDASYFTVNIINGSQTVCYNTVPAPITISVQGNVTKYDYQWQSSADGITWTDLKGEKKAVFSPPVLTSSIIYRCLVNGGGTATFSVAAITVLPPGDCPSGGTK